MMMFEGNVFQGFLVYTLIFFLAILFRYFVAAGIFYYYYYIKNFKKYDERRLSKRLAKKEQLKKEIIWSVKSSAIFAFFGALLYWLWQQDLTAIYLDPQQYTLWYLPLSLIIVSLDPRNLLLLGSSMDAPS